MQKNITDHYGSDDLTSKIFSALVKAGKEPNNLEIKDTSIIDQLHTGGHLATLELAKKVGIYPEYQILDAGCGIGGSSRLLAKTFQCQVTGIDIVPQFIDVANQLAKSTKTDEKVNFICGDITKTGLLNSSFDLIWCQHTLMNIEPKSDTFAEFKRLLKPGGLMVLHEIVKGSGVDIYLPVPWAATFDISFLISWKEMEQLIIDNGFNCHFMEDSSDKAKLWWEKVNTAFLKNKEISSMPPLGPHIIFGENGRLFGHTMSNNFKEDRIRLIEAVYVNV